MAGVVFHVLNRGNCRMDLFTKPGDFQAFVKLLEEGRRRLAMPILGYCLMHNHWHLVLQPSRVEDLGRFMQWVCSTHVRRWREHRGSVGQGHLYQGRFKSFPVQDDHHLLTLLRYVEANPLRAGMIKRAEQWPWSSLGNGQAQDGTAVQLSDWPVDRPHNWVQSVNRPLDAPQLDDLRRCVQRGRPFGADRWVRRTVKTMHLESTMRDPWRPRKTPQPKSTK